MGIFEEAAIFRGVTKEDARQMLNCLNPVEKTYKKDEIIYHAGDEVTSMGVVLSGSVFIENDDIWGNHSILDRAGRGEIFAETYAAIPRQKLMVNVVAAEEARIKAEQERKEREEARKQAEAEQPKARPANPFNMANQRINEQPAFVEQPKEQPVSVQLELLTRAFKVTTTRENIIALGNFMNERGIDFDKIEI